MRIKMQVEVKEPRRLFTREVDWPAVPGHYDTLALTPDGWEEGVHAVWWDFEGVPTVTIHVLVLDAEECWALDQELRQAGWAAHSAEV